MEESIGQSFRPSRGATLSKAPRIVVDDRLTWSQQLAATGLKGVDPKFIEERFPVQASRLGRVEYEVELVYSRPSTTPELLVQMGFRHLLVPNPAQGLAFVAAHKYLLVEGPVVLLCEGWCAEHEHFIQPCFFWDGHGVSLGMLSNPPDQPWRQVYRFLTIRQSAQA